ncbi:MAG: 5-formyltetrahydrofolate cyclo-ligase [Phycisphaerales bacterium JB063]
MNHTDAKAALRASIIDQRDAIPAADRAARCALLLQDVLALPQVACAQRVFAFVSHGSEVETHPIIDALLDAGKQVAVPLILPRKDDPDRRMLAVPIRSRDELTPGVMGIPSPPIPETPDPAPETRFHPDLVLVPGVAFQALTPKKIARLGYGGGYYDRYLARHPAAITVGLSFREQLIEALPTESHDVPLNGLLHC